MDAIRLWLVTLLMWALAPLARYYDRVRALCGFGRYHAIRWFYYSDGIIESVDDYPVSGKHNVALVPDVPSYLHPYVRGQLLRNKNTIDVIFGCCEEEEAEAIAYRLSKTAPG